MDPLEQIFEQAHSATGKWDMPAQMFIAGQQHARANRALALQEREVALSEQMRPMELEARQLAAQHYWLDSQIKFLQMEREVKSKEAQARLLQLHLRADANPEGWDENLINQAYDIVGANPGAGATEIGLLTAKSIKASQAVKRQQQFINAHKDMVPVGFTTDENDKLLVQYKKLGVEEEELSHLPEGARYKALESRARAKGNVELADYYKKAADTLIGKTEATARLAAHKELATTIRQQMKAIDADTSIKPAEREARKAVLMRQIEESRRSLLPVIEGVQESMEIESMSDELTKLDKQIADIDIDIAKNPDKGTFDFGTDNRVLKKQNLEAQRTGLINALVKKRAGEPAATQPAQAPAPDRVKVKSPDGTIGTIPRSQLDQAIQEGYTEVP